MSTVSPKVSGEMAAQLARREIPYLRAPVSGSVPVAEAGKLTVYASGPRELFDRCRDLFGTFSTKQAHVGANEEGRIVKLAINLIVQMSTAVLGEVLAFGDRAGVDRSLLMDAINDSIVGSPHYAVRAEAFKRRDLTSTVRWASPKDLDIALSVARETGAIMPIASLLEQYIRIITNRPVAQNGFTALTTLMEDINPIAR
jgi:3-hydroxyisobutyrate dehydrogenase